MSEVEVDGLPVPVGHPEIGLGVALSGQRRRGLAQQQASQAAAPAGGQQVQCIEFPASGVGRIAQDAEVAEAHHLPAGRCHEGPRRGFPGKGQRPTPGDGPGVHRLQESGVDDADVGGAPRLHQGPGDGRGVIHRGFPHTAVARERAGFGQHGPHPSPDPGSWKPEYPT